MRYVGRLPTEEPSARGGGKKLGYTNEIFIDAVNRFVSASAGGTARRGRCTGSGGATICTCLIFSSNNLIRSSPHRHRHSLTARYCSTQRRLPVSKSPIYKKNHSTSTFHTRDASTRQCRILASRHSSRAPTRPTPLDGAGRVRAGELLERRHLRRRHGRLCAAPAEDLAAHRKRPRRLVEAEQER